MKTRTFRTRKQTCIPGARLLKDDENNVILDDKGRPVWQKPEPVAFVRHFKNEAAKRKHLEGELIDFERATVNVPVYAGMDQGRYRYLKAQARRSIRKQNTITEIIEDDDNISEGNSGQHVPEGNAPDNVGVGVS